MSKRRRHRKQSYERFRRLFEKAAREVKPLVEREKAGEKITSEIINFVMRDYERQMANVIPVIVQDVKKRGRLAEEARRR